MLGTTAGLLGSLMAHEALKVWLGFGDPLVNRLLVFDGTTSRFREVLVRRNPDCAVCGGSPTIRELVAVEGTVCIDAQRSDVRGRTSEGRRQNSLASGL